MAFADPIPPLKPRRQLRSVMADADRGGIPLGLHRIRTRRIPPEASSSSGGESSPTVSSRRAGANSSSSAGGFLKPGAVDSGASNSRGSRTGRKFTRWISSYLSSRDSNKPSSSVPPNTVVKGSPVKLLGLKDLMGGKYSLEGKNPTKRSSMPLGGSAKKAPVTIKSFSHELGPRGGVRTEESPRARSYNDLKELLGSLHSKFDAAKEAVSAELAIFAGDVLDALAKDTSLRADKTAEDLLFLSQQCVEMTSSQFREKCGIIVQSLAERRQQCQAGPLKKLITRMLFILTRCTRVLQFQKDSWPISEDSIDRFKQCLESVPAVEMKRVLKPRKPAFSLDSTVEQDFISENSSEDNKIPIHSAQSLIIESDASSFGLLSHLIDDGLPESQSHKFNRGSLDGPEEFSEESDLVICRICEKNVPTSHLESHSYICAYADKCDLECLDVDVRLIKIAEILEQIVESYNINLHASDSTHEIPRVQSDISTFGSEVHSPKVQEWRNKGTEGMFEDLHEMDTACIEDPQITSYNNLKSVLALKLGSCHATSSNGSMTPGSSTTTPRSSHFDLYWLEHNNPSEHEDVNQMNELADIAHKVASLDLATEGSSKYLGMWLHDLLDILRLCQLKALVIDTFGSRILNLLKEKYLMAFEIMDKKRLEDVVQLEETGGHFVVQSSQGTTPAPLRPPHKERTSIDDFEIIKPISRGAYGKVFLARKRITGDLFAIKVLKKLDMIRKNDIERILAERNILITVRNPFVVRFFYSFTCRDNLYLVMEYLNGGDLYSLLRKLGCLEEHVARVYIAELVLALEYLHSLGIIHRDLKPDNILIARDGHIKLTDFGLSKIGLINSSIDLSGSETSGSTLLDDENQRRLLEHAHERGLRSRSSAVGTPDYLAPEILLGTAHGYAADWWSVGIILFELITGIPPFTARLPEMIFDNILNRKIPWPHVPDDMSHEAKDLIDRFLTQDPDLRLGANGASEVKAHPFFKEINWDNLSLQKAAFVPHTDGEEDTSYFMSRYSSNSGEIHVDANYAEFNSDATDSGSNSDLEINTDESDEMLKFDSSASVDLSSINFSFKNLSQLASMNYDVLLQSGRNSKCSSPSCNT